MLRYPNSRLLLNIFLLFVCLTFGVTQNNPNLDSLHQLLRKAKEDTNKVNILHQLVKGYEYNEFDKAVTYAQQQFELATELDYSLGISQAELNRGFQDIC